MKTRIDILVTHHDSVLTQLIANEITLRELETRVLIVKPSEQYKKIVKATTATKAKIEGLQLVLKIIKKMMNEEMPKKKMTN